MNIIFFNLKQPYNFKFNQYGNTFSLLISQRENIHPADNKSESINFTSRTRERTHVTVKVCY